MRLLDMAWWTNQTTFSTSIVTDHGVFDAVIWREGSTFAIGFGDPDGENVVWSNTLSSCSWAEANRELREYVPYGAMYAFYRHGGLDFSGEITAENIDAIISFVLNCADWHEEATNLGDEKFLFSGDFVRKVVQDFFAVQSVDLTLSQSYDAENDTYQFYHGGWGSGPKYCPYQLEWKNDSWYALVTDPSWSTDDASINTLHIKMNADLQIEEIYIVQTDLPGDCDGDGRISASDITRLAQYVAGWNVEISESGADCDGDGRITANDIARLAQYVAGWNVTLG
jgi:hypothetical protein